MKIKDLQRPELRETGISIRTFPSYAAWLKDKNISPSKLFNEAVKELKEEDEKEVEWSEISPKEKNGEQN